MIETVGKTLLAMAAGMLAATSIAAAADAVVPAPTPAPNEERWSFNVAPYVWAAGLDGTIAEFGFPPVEVDASFSDILENFDIGLMGAGEGRYGDFGLLTDFMYVKLSTSASTPFGVIADHIDVDSTTFTAFAGAEYRLAENESGSLDILGGGRLWYVDTEIDPVGGPADPLSFSDGDTWVDPIIGAKGRINLSNEFYLTGWGMIGGFGASSKFTWDVMGALGYEITTSTSVVGGWRALAVDHTDGDFVFDVVQSGPILGAVFRF